MISIRFGTATEINIIIVLLEKRGWLIPFLITDTANRKRFPIKN